MTATAVVLRNAPSSLDFPRASRLSRSVRAALLSLAMAAGAVPLCASAAEAAAEQARPYAIPAGQLGDVLNRFAREAGITLSATPAQTGGYSSQGLRGSFTVQQGRPGCSPTPRWKRKTRATAASSCARRRQRTATC